MGTYVYLWLIHVDIWQKPTQCCKASILQLKTGKRKNSTLVTGCYLPHGCGQLVLGVEACELWWGA